MKIFIFYFFSGIAIASAGAVIASSRPTRALISLIVTLFALAVLYLLLGAVFVAMAHLIVYAGAVLVLFLFVIMLQGVGAKDMRLKRRFSFSHRVLTYLTGLGFAALMTRVALQTRYPQPAGVMGTVEKVGQVLLQDYLLPFELTSVLLLLGIFAGVSLTKKEEAA